MPANCLSVFDHFVKLGLKGLKENEGFRNRCGRIIATKNITKITLIVLVEVEKVIAVVQLKKSWEELNIGIRFKYLINTQLLIAKW